MKARKIVRGAAAGLLSISLLFSGLPVAAAESGYHTPLSVKKTERGSSKALEQNPAGEQQSPGSSRTGEGGESQNPSGSQTGDANYTQNPAEGTESTQNPPGEQGSSDMSRTEGTGNTQNPSEGSGQTGNPSEEQGRLRPHSYLLRSHPSVQTEHPALRLHPHSYPLCSHPSNQTGNPNSLIPPQGFWYPRSGFRPNSPSALLLLPDSDHPLPGCQTDSVHPLPGCCWDCPVLLTD